MEEKLNQRDFLNRPPHRFGVDLAGRQLAGPKVVQGQGLVGHGICVVLAEEYGRWPRYPHLLAVKMIDLTQENSVIINGRIPISFAAKAGVRETEESHGNRITVEWEDLETGIETGFKVTATVVDDGLCSPTFAGKSTASVDEENISIYSEHCDATNFV